MSNLYTHLHVSDKVHLENSAVVEMGYVLLTIAKMKSMLLLTLSSTVDAWLVVIMLYLIFEM